MVLRCVTYNQKYNSGAAYLYLREMLILKGKLWILTTTSPVQSFYYLTKIIHKTFSRFSWCYIVEVYASFFKDIVWLQETILEWILTLCIMSAEWMYCKIRWQNLCNSPSSHLLISSLENTALPQPTQFRCSSLAAEGTSCVSVGSRWVFHFASP